jgi:hypothetical protein
MRNELPMPDGAAEEPDAQEMARIWVMRTNFLVSLRVGSYSQALGGTKESAAWGELLADTIKHVAKAISLRYDVSPVEAQHEILSRCSESLELHSKQFFGSLRTPP